MLPNGLEEVRVTWHGWGYVGWGARIRQSFCEDTGKMREQQSRQSCLERDPRLSVLTAGQHRQAGGTWGIRPILSFGVWREKSLKCLISCPRPPTGLRLRRHHLTSLVSVLQPNESASHLLSFTFCLTCTYCWLCLK